MKINVEKFVSVKSFQDAQIKACNIRARTKKGEYYLYERHDSLLLVIPLATDTDGTVKALHPDQLPPRQLLNAAPDDVDNIVYLCNIQKGEPVPFGYALVYQGLNHFSALKIPEKYVDLKLNLGIYNDVEAKREQLKHLVETLARFTESALETKMLDVLMQRLYKHHSGVKYTCLAGFGVLDKLVAALNEAEQKGWCGSSSDLICTVILSSPFRLDTRHANQKNELTHIASVILLLESLGSLPKAFDECAVAKLIQRLALEKCYLWDEIMQQILQNTTEPLRKFFEVLHQGLQFEDKKKPNIERFLRDCAAVLS